MYFKVRGKWENFPIVYWIMSELLTHCSCQWHTFHPDALKSVVHLEVSTKPAKFVFVSRLIHLHFKVK